MSELIHPDPVVCTCGYDILKGRHSDDCPMGKFWRWVEFKTARRCAEIAIERPHRKGYTIADKIHREFGLSMPESNGTPVERAMERFRKRIDGLKAEGKFPPTPESDSTEDK